MNLKVRKPIFAFLILFLLVIIMIPVTMISIIISFQKRAEMRDQLKKEGTISTLRIVESEVNSVFDIMNEKTDAVADLMGIALTNFVTEKGYDGPEIFEDGVVIYVDGDEIRYPEGFGRYFANLTPELLREDMVLEADSLVKASDPGIEETVYLTLEKITDDTWYVDWTTSDDYDDMSVEHQQTLNSLADLEKAYGGYLLLFSRGENNYRLIYHSPNLGKAETIMDLGFTEEDIKNEISMVTMNNEIYTSTFINLRMFHMPVTAVLMVSYDNEISYMVNCIGLVVLFTVVVILALILWLYWTQAYVRDNPLTQAQIKDYHPRHIRKIVFSVGLIGTILLFAVAVIWQSLNSLYREAQEDRESLELLISHIISAENEDSGYREQEETWFVYYGKRIAELLAGQPELRNSGFLESVNDLIGSEYIMLFDGEGNEIVSSNAYVGLSIESEFTAAEDKLRKIMYGDPEQILDPEYDPIAEKLTQIIALRYPDPDRMFFGALVIAIDPEKGWKRKESVDLNSFMKVVTPEGNLSAVVETESSVVRYSSFPDMLGEYADLWGLDVAGRSQSDLDMFTVGMDDYYGPFEEVENYRFYYLTDTANIQENTLLFAGISAGVFLVIYVIISLFMLWPYRDKIYEETVSLKKNEHQDTMLDDPFSNEWLKFQNTDERKSFREAWRHLVPGKKVTIFLQIFLALIQIILMFMLVNPRSGGARSALAFILRGNWKRGVNLLAFSGLVLIFIAFVIFVFFKNLLLVLLGNVVDRKVDTVLRLIFSLIQYAAIISLLYFAFGYLGFDTRALLASVSFLSLAVSLGAQGLVADILAGIFIIFEDDFNVGDIIEVNGFSGIVQEIGVRSTKLIGIGDNVKIIGNQAVKNVLNMSKMNTWYSLELKVPSDYPLLEVEEMLERELPLIGESVPEILSGPYYKGVVAIGDVNTLYINAECRQEDYRKVQRNLNHAMRLLFDQNGIRLR